MMEEETKEEGLSANSEDSEVQDNRVEDLSKVVREQSEMLKELRKDRDMLFEIADKKRRARWLQRHKEDLPTKMYVAKYDGKIVVGWSVMPKNVVRKDARTQAWHEEQTVKLMYADGSKSDEVPYSEWYLHFEKVPAERTGTIKDEKSGSVAFKLKLLDTGEKVTIGDTFVNP